MVDPPPDTGWKFECAGCGRRQVFPREPESDEVTCPSCGLTQPVDHPGKTLVFDTACLELWDDRDGLATATSAPATTLSASAGPPPRRLRRYVVSETADPTADFVILELLGKGGMGEVLLARQTSIDRPIAFKRMLQATSGREDSRRKFMAEVTVTGWLEHPNIVGIHELGEDQDGRLFYTMQQVVGVPWSAVLEEKDLLDNLEIFLRVCDAAAYAHSRGIIHRDLKPSNVMLGAYGEVVVMDWGIAVTRSEQINGERLRPDNAVAGSPSYMAPEMARGDLNVIGVGSDIYLLGGILFKLVTGKTPHMGRTSTDCIRAAVRNEIVAHEPDTELTRVARKALSSRIEDRHRNVEELAESVRSYLRHHQSITLSDQAEALLGTAIFEQDYQKFTRALNGFENAVEIWSGNQPAQAGIARARLAFATCALERNDLDLATSLLDETDPAHAVVLGRVQIARGQRDNLVQAAERNRRWAMLEATRNRSSNAFLLDILRQASPEQLGPSATILQAVDEAAKQIDTRFANDLPTLANLHATLGMIYRDAHHRKEAATHLARAGNLLKEAGGENSPAVTAWRNEWGQFLLQVGRLDEAEHEFGQVLAEMHRQCDDNHPNLLAAMNNLANVQQRMGKFVEAEEQLRAVLAASERGFGPIHPTSIVSRLNLAKVLGSQGRTSDAAALYREVLEHQTADLGPTHPHTLTTLQEMARLWYSAGNLPAAAEHYAALHAARSQVHGSTSAEAITARTTLVKVLFASGQTDAAIEHARGALADLGGAAGTEAPKHELLLLLAELLLAREDAAGAMTQARAAAALEERQPDAVWSDGYAATVWAMALAADGDLDTAVPLALAGAHRLRELRGEADPQAVLARRRATSIVIPWQDAGEGRIPTAPPVELGTLALGLAEQAQTDRARAVLTAAIAALTDKTGAELAKQLDRQLHTLG